MSKELFDSIKSISNASNKAALDRIDSMIENEKNPEMKEFYKDVKRSLTEQYKLGEIDD